MKKIFFIAVALFLGSYALQAQNNTNDIQDSNDLFFNMLSSTISGVEVTYPNLLQSDLWKGYPLPHGHIIFPRTIHVDGVPYDVTEIAPWTFSNCVDIVELFLTDKLRVIGFSAFAFCEGLTHLELPISVQEIGGCAFIGCHNLTHLTIPEKVNEIKGHTFADCTSLTTIDLPANLTEIGRSAFDRSGLTTITIPASVERIGKFAFRGCKSLRSIKVTSTVPPEVTPNAFDDIPDDCILYIPDSYRVAYEEADGWKQFTHMEEY